MLEVVTEDIIEEVIDFLLKVSVNKDDNNPYCSGCGSCSHDDWLNNF